MVSDNPFERYIEFLVERHRIYISKMRGDPWPWTEDPILQEFSFTNVYREIDKTSLHYQRTVRKRYVEDPMVFPATVLYRWFNRMSTCDAIFNEPNLGNTSVFEEYIFTCERPSLLFNLINSLDPPVTTGAFITTGRPGSPKGIGIMEYFHDWCTRLPWRQQWNEWKRNPPALQEMFMFISRGEGLGSFMAAQIVADLKYLPFMLHVEDWWSWASPGPGSQRGLNAVLGRPMFRGWTTREWLQEIQILRDRENAALADYGMGPFHAQDTQNHCCEFSKYEKTRLRLGRPRVRYHHA